MRRSFTTYLLGTATSRTATTTRATVWPAQHIRFASSTAAAVHHINNKRCEICDDEFTSWQEHSMELGHRARHAVCSVSVNPQKHEALMQQLWEHIQLDFAMVDEVNDQKIERRQNRLKATLQHLCREKAIHSALLRYELVEEGEMKKEDSELPVKKYNITAGDDFEKFVLLGERELRYQVVDRVTRLYPTMPASDIRAVVAYVCSQRNISELFDAVGVSGLENCDTLMNEAMAINNWKPAPVKTVAEGDAKQEEPTTAGESGAVDEKMAAEGGHNAPAGPTFKIDTDSLVEAEDLDNDTKTALILAVLGELQCYSNRDKAYHVADNAVAKDIVHTVLATHAMENTISELVHHVLQRVIDEGTPVWADYVDSLEELRKTGLRPPEPMTAGLTAAPSAPPITTTDATKEAKDEDLKKLILRAANSANARVSFAGSVTPNYQELIRGSALDITVPNAVNKTAFYAPSMPKLTPKPRKS